MRVDGDVGGCVAGGLVFDQGLLQQGNALQPWPVAASGLSLDVGNVRVRFDGGSPELRRVLARWISRSRTWVEQMSGASRRSGGRRSGAARGRGGPQMGRSIAWSIEQTSFLACCSENEEENGSGSED